MGHSKPEDIADLKTELLEISKLPGVIQKSPGVFYWKRIPLLHFHDRGDDRHVDIKQASGGWKRLSLKFEASTSARKKFLSAAKSAHKKFNSK